MVRRLIALLVLSGAVSPAATVQEHVAALSGPDALAEWKAGRALVAAGDAGVPHLYRLAAADGPIQPRLVAIDLLAEIGSESARNSLLQLLREERRNLIVRGHLCVHLGRLRERRAVPQLIGWLDTISGPRSIQDIRAPKEAQPSTCYIRHIEALWMIGDERAIPALERFEKRVPRGVGYGGFLSSMLLRAAQHALQELRASEEFWRPLRAEAGLEDKLEPLFAHLRSDPVAVFRHHESLIIHRDPRAREIVEALTEHPDPAVAKGARLLIARGREGG